MVVDDIIPETDISVDWSILVGAGTHEGAIDEDKGSPSTADHIAASDLNGDDQDVEEFGLSTLVDVGEVTSVTVYVYGYVTAAPYSGHLDVDFFDGVGWQGYEHPGIPVGAYGWCNHTFAGLSMTQANLNDAKLRFRADLQEKGNVYVATAYIAVTYSEAVAGYAHDFLGVPAANIGSVIGVPTANIANIIGV